MANIYLFSGPCGCAKSTLAAAYAKQLERPAYLIHGDDFQGGFMESEDPSKPHVAWTDILRFNWRCILNVARSALELGLDVVIDYVVEDELPLVTALANDFMLENQGHLFDVTGMTVAQEIAQFHPTQFIVSVY